MRRCLVAMAAVSTHLDAEPRGDDRCQEHHGEQAADDDYTQPWQGVGVAVAASTVVGASVLAAAMAVRLEHQGAQGGAEREGVECGDHGGCRDRERELLKELTGDAGQEC